MGGDTVPTDPFDTAHTPRDEPNTRSAPDRCPTTTVLHHADDGVIARLRLPGGRLTGAAARAVAHVAAPGDTIELTARGNLQLRGLTIEGAAGAAAALDAVGLTPSAAHDRRESSAGPHR
jgi:precorrin-3B synthase